MKTRIQKLLVCAALVGAATLVQAHFFNYTANRDGTCTITRYVGPGGAVTIPNSISSLIVVSIGSDAFSGNSFLTNVTIPDSVTSVGFGAFEACPSLTAITVDPANSFYSSVDGVLFDKNQTTLIEFPGGRGGSYTIPASVTSIGKYAFEYCSSPTSVTIPNSVTNIGDYAFYYCSLTNLTIGNGVTSIGWYAFFGCHGLTNVTIPAGVANLVSGAFGGCYAMTAITVDAANSFYSSANGVLFDKNQTTLIEFPAGRGGSYAIPASVTNIGDLAFITCISLANVTIRSGVARIGSGAFGRCTSLTSVTIPASLTSIGYRAFDGCTSLTAAYFLGNAPPDPGNVFGGYTTPADPVTIYYLPGATGWGPFFSRRPTELWNPQASALRVTGGHFGFNISGPSNTVIVVEVCTNPAHPVWLPVSTNALDGSGASSFSDSESGNYPARFYRFRSP